MKDMIWSRSNAILVISTGLTLHQGRPHTNRGSSFFVPGIQRQAHSFLASASRQSLYFSDSS
jgi:hypothetical protein